MSGVAREAMEDVAPAAPGVGEFGVASCGVLLASVVGVIFGPTGLVISSFSLFIEPIAADLDWDRGQSALPVTLLGLAVALSSPLKGWLVDRWGARALVLPLTAALALSLGIAIQNFPEGAIISMPLRANGMSKPRAFLQGLFSGVAELLAALATLCASRIVVPALPYLLSFAAGAMMYVVVEELIPETSQGSHSNLGTVFFSLGFTLMLVLDVALAA